MHDLETIIAVNQIGSYHELSVATQRTRELVEDGPTARAWRKKALNRRIQLLRRVAQALEEENESLRQAAEEE